MLLLLAVHLVAALLSSGQASGPPAPNSTNPILVEAIAPTYPRARFSNPSRTVLVGLTVNVSGLPEDVHIVRSGGDRFDRNAVYTVTQYKFKAAREAGQPVARDIQVEVSYRVK